ncbi:MAG: pyridoxal 5'-phosphate synthase glutaminase subunit PdxT [Candidatus Hatepunaea meridiana]|nr:pyridoxal 5'-phosphate synthase glutaminase subunit PdxT [Candidatus Hatepunaea meridiana]
MRIGVLAVQGSFSLHARIINKLDIETVEVRRTSDLDNLNGIIIPGGESTTFQIILDASDLGSELRRELRAGLPAWGTCAGAIMLGHSEGNPPGWGLIDIEVFRNDYGRQVDSFVAPLRIKGFTEKFDGVFIRAPRFRNPGRGVEILAEYNGLPVMARQGNLLITSFHPELTSDLHVHRYFISELCTRLNKDHLKSA